MTTEKFTSPAAAALPRPRVRKATTLRLAGAAALVIGTAGLLGGCVDGPSHSVTVGAVPQDYRTRHPIIVSEQEKTLDLPVASGDRKLVQANVDIVRGFVHRYREVASGLVRIMVPHGSTNAGAASFIARNVRHVLVANGVPASRIIIAPYSAEGYDDAPLRLAYMATSAHTTPCGRWPQDLSDDPENRGYENFGCASQSNLAAQVANPGDLLAPRGMTPIDSERRTTIYDNYVTNGNGSSSN